jgi:hypothetical protein
MSSILNYHTPSMLRAACCGESHSPPEMALDSLVISILVIPIPIVAMLVIAILTK